MAKNIKIEELVLKLDMAFEVLAREKDSIEIPALKECEGAMKQRIHNRGQDSDGNRIGIKGKNKGLYSKSYEKYKEKISGGNLYPINLQLHGDLIRSLTVGKTSETNCLEFTDELSAKKVERHENSYNTEIYRPSQSELDGVRDVYIIGFKKALEKAFGNL